MRRVRWLVALALLLIPGVAHAIQLHWSSGADTLTFSEATRAILVLRADSAEAPLPPEWRLLWVGDSTEVEIVALDSLEVCAGDTAQVYGVDGPATPEDSTAHRVTAHFCSGGSSAAEQATFVLDLPAWGRGKCKVVALDPADSSAVLESNEVAFNGGVSDPFQPVVFAASQSRSSTTVCVTAVGAGLSTVQQSSIVASDSSWTAPLTLVQRTASSLTATAYVPASLPPALLEVASGGGQVASAPLSGDEVLAPTGDYSYGSFVSPESNVRPKDFTFFYDNLGRFHLFYMRQCITPTDTCERRIAHVWGTGLRDDWSSPDIASFTTDSSHSWDAARLWAPSLMQHGGTYYLFYTGVDNQGNQAIGVATTGNINTTNIAWNRPASAIVSRSTIPWIDGIGQAQCRDPFVMEDPANPGEYVMLYTSQIRVSGTAKPAIGVARASASGLTQSWADDGRLEVVDVIPQLYGPYMDYGGKTESPHAFAHVNASGDTSYYVVATGSDGAVPRHARLLRNRRSPWDHGTDTGPEHWNLSSSLFDELGFAVLDTVVFGGWEATEYCRMYGHEYLAAINASPQDTATYAVWIVMLQWSNGGTAPDQMALLNPVTSVEEDASTGGRVEVNGLRLSGRNPGGAPVGFEVALAGDQSAQLDVYDMQGRRVRTLSSGLTTAGRHRLSWDGRDAQGGLVPCGIYFARLRWTGGQSVVRLVLVR